MDENERIHRILKEQEIIARAMHDAFMASKHGKVCITLSTAARANCFKDMCCRFLEENHIAFKHRKSTVTINGLNEIVFLSQKANNAGYYKVLGVWL